ncbi:N/A [soil metagenome]
MKILHVDHSPILGGAERSVLELARAQGELGHDVSVAVGRRGAFTAALAEAGVRWHDLGWSERYVAASRVASGPKLVAALPDLLRAALALRRLVVRARPDVVQAHTRKSQVVAALALIGFSGALVWHLRDDLPSRPPLRALITLLLRRADHAVALSDWLARSYADRGALPRSGHIGIVPSGVDPRALAELPTPWLDGKRDPIVGFVGQVARWKAPHLLVEAAEELMHQPVTFRIVGAVWFPAAEEGYGRWLGRRIASSPAAAAVEWRAAADGPAAAFTEIDVLVHTSIEPEPFGRVLVEAMAARRPIVALGHGSALELLDDSSAVFAERPDGASVARAVQLLISDRDAAGRLAERAAGRAAAYSPAAVAMRMDAEYLRLGR